MSPDIITVDEVPGLIKDGQTVGADGFTMMGVADEIYAAIQESYLATKHPANLTFFHISGQSNRETGMERLAEPGLLRRIVGSHWGLAPRMGKLINDDGVEGVCLPQGQASNLLRAIAAGRLGNIARVGLRTFVDPDVEGGRVNRSARRALEPNAYIEKILVGGEEQLLYKSFPLM